MRAQRRARARALPGVNLRQRITWTAEGDPVGNVVSCALMDNAVRQISGQVGTIIPTPRGDGSRAFSGLSGGGLSVPLSRYPVVNHDYPPTFGHSGAGGADWSDPATRVFAARLARRR
jgi:hypothetical protein